MYTVMKSARFRSLPTMTTNDTGASSIVGDTFESTVTQPDTKNPAVIMVQHPNGKWLPIKIDNVEYTRYTSSTPPVDDDDISVTVTRTDGVTSVDVDGEAWQKKP